MRLIPLRQTEFDQGYFPGGSDGKESACNAGDWGSIPGLGRSPEKGMATHSSILAWRIPWTKEPGGLESVGSQKATEHAACTHTPQSLERENSVG